jgi:hypothetical protein
MMEDELTPEEKFAAQNAEIMVPRALLEGRKVDDVVADLIRLDWTPATARVFVERVVMDLYRYYESPESRHQLVREARKQALAGLLLTLIASGVTASTFLGFLAGALPFWVGAAGMWVFGVILLARGWSRWRLYRQTELFVDSARQSPDG